jgi:accessory colonization factor AcfC
VAEAERAGNPLPARELEQIERLKAEIVATERAIADRQTEIETVTANYQEDIERFQELLDVVELRRNLEKPQDGKAPR